MSNSDIIIEITNEVMDQTMNGDEESAQIIVENTEFIDPIEDKSFIIDLVNKLDNRLSFVSKEGKSEVWNRYQRIYYMNRSTPFVKCMYCNDIKKQTKYTGTATLLRHQCLRSGDCMTTEEQLVGQDWDLDQTFNNINNHKNNENLMINPIESHNDKSFLISLIESSDTRLSFEPQIGKSEVWTRFERIVFNNIETQYVKCNYCNEIIKHTRTIGTASLLRHRCKTGQNSNAKRLHRNSAHKVLRTTKCATIDEKIRVENKTLKTIVKKCLEVIEKCLCINRTIVLEKKRINVFIKGYNEWLFQNQEFDDFDESKDNFEDIFGTNHCLDDNSTLKANELSDDSDRDLDYDPIKDQKPKSQLMSNQRGLKSINKLIFASNLVKKKYKKQKCIVSNQQKVVCDWPECGRVFKSSYNLKQHHDKHIGVARYKCLWPGCDETFSKKVQYEIHTCAHTNEKKFKCDFPLCHYESCRSNMLQRHKKVHSGERPHKCDWPGCDFKTSHKNGLRHHKYRHTGEKPWKCSWPSCEWSFRQSTHLKAHMLKHTGEKPFECLFEGCDRRFASRQAMRFHSEKFHNININTNQK